MHSIVTPPLFLSLFRHSIDLSKFSISFSLALLSELFGALLGSALTHVGERGGGQIPPSLPPSLPRSAASASARLRPFVVVRKPQPMAVRLSVRPFVRCTMHVGWQWYPLTRRHGGEDGGVRQTGLSLLCLLQTSERTNERTNERFLEVSRLSLGNPSSTTTSLLAWTGWLAAPSLPPSLSVSSPPLPRVIRK